MQTNSGTIFSILMRISSWPTLLTGGFLYAIGTGIVVFRGEIVEWTHFWMGLALVILLLMSSFFLNEYFSKLLTPNRKGVNKPIEPSQETGPGVSRNLVLLIAVTVLTAGAMITVVLFATGAFNPTVLLVLGLAFLLAFLYAVPPFRLVYSGYGELVMAILLTNLFPALGYLLQTGEMSELLGMLTFPLTALYLAMTLAISLETYFSDIKAGRQNLMIRLGWQRGMILHNVLILSAYVLVGIGAFVGMAWALTWPKLLTLPIGLFQLWQIWLISRGAKPRWKILRITALATFAITVYLQTFTLWVG